MAEHSTRQDRSAARRRPPRASEPSGAGEAAERAASDLAKLIDRPVEGCSEVSPTDDGGWLVGVDVVEVSRIPDTTSLLATYEVELAEDGSMRRYRRTRRYVRGSADI
ncbi:Gas vesicle synthesis protein GvpO [Actinacidiphila paucisporea]|uniref:Gas vesicle synthesis protein GvpO n=2 Tax=Actinacidiphila paucisporea TaxID=310782 RepID=A0A1M7M0L2_9ACTN|nr:Gas vesicle synthesis protein GvpO [Actinacidiphila paucisporea]